MHRIQIIQNYPILSIRSVCSPFLSLKVPFANDRVAKFNKSQDTTSQFYVQLMLIEMFAKSNSVFIGPRLNKNSFSFSLSCKNTDQSPGVLPDWPGLMARFCRHISLPFSKNPILNGAILAISTIR